MKYAMLALILGGVAVAPSGCNKDGSADDKAAAASAESTGIPECDDYVKKTQACLAKMTGAAKSSMEATFGNTRDTIKAGVGTPEGKMALKATCKMMADAVATTPACK